MIRRTAFIFFLQRDASAKFQSSVSAHYPLFVGVPLSVSVECYVEGDASVVFPGAQWLRERFLCDVGVRTKAR